MPNNELATINDSSAIDLLPPAQSPSVVARQMLRAHAEMMHDAHQLAVAMCGTQMVPVRFRGKPDDGAAAILYGSELGLNPIQSLQRIIPIHGMPSLEARTMVALLKAKGYRVRTTAVSDESVTVQGIDLDGEVYESTWTMDRAKRAGYVPEIDQKTGRYKVNKNGNLLGNEKYLSDPIAMLKAKAQSEVCRDMAPEVLLGISYTREELESERFDDSELPAAAPASNAPVTVEEILGSVDPVPVPEDEAAVEPETEPEPDVEPQPPATSNACAEPDSAEPSAKAKALPTEKTQATSTRRALERRLFKLLGQADIPVENRDDRLLIYRAIVGREDIGSTDHLTDAQVAQVCDTLYLWQQRSVLDAQITDILNSATLREEANAEEEQQTTETEGK